ncbi:MAG TPA: bifunctional diaminohydroxyphosphoribosylaminopyrimidine deaminase/5-amino-6-(5-phosphoribosylamino)uracil reductase RibD [Thiobacillus sp.]|nr:MAG: riboflavin biosynthesis protein RibD [Hydrogenophilales bacterium 16-61-112]OZA48882.1 MAG: riboflavin biosynthesis protein RibD [Hydrogenophilales bacterium 17-61-76]HQT30037.1 bifunctional diaminohydroxyphosphoribosylaminopyrimidine deaminase/5-amino-6-(5-phosphoribosylamino)uracil reductase RibD [Thiobacillus sp.]HQT70723.1 bifunctional diaminohydroxyphosphoribosylaminopyrimidine deaminase/5-amino-6-(5-phosphoribosylamino)uracil reductase RibD [Thiobacillus sp.]
MRFSAADHAHMARALQLAARGLFTTTPNPRVGCVIVRNGTVVSEGWHQRVGTPHAEVHALQAAGDAARGATAYVTLEPCSHHGRTPPCAEALIQAGVVRVVAAMTDPNPLVAGGGIDMLTLAGITAEVGLMETEARALNPGFISRMTRQRPWVRLKTASTLDGKTALANGQSQWITGATARADVQHLRARACATLTGSGTVLADNPRMNVRDFDIGRQPLRVVVDSALRTPADAAILPALIACHHADPTARAALERSGAEVVELPGMDGRVDLAALLTLLAQRGVNELHVEAGAALNGALLAAGLVDEWVAYVAPMSVGDDARGLFAQPTLATLADAARFRLADVRQVGGDLRLTLLPK